MTIYEFAEGLNGRDYGKEIYPYEERRAKELGFVVVFGYSDDNTEFRGAVYEEIGCFDGGRVYEDGEKYIDAVWCDDGYSWTYNTNIPHATFDIYDGCEKYCKGIVFKLKDMELNRENIIKALEHCTSSTSSEACDGCPFNDMELCDRESNAIEKHALALIKELTEDNENLNKTISNLLETIKDIKSDTLRSIRTQVNNKAVFPDGTREHGYITLKAFDNIIDSCRKE